MSDTSSVSDLSPLIRKGRQMIPLDTKLEVIRRMENGQTRPSVCRALNLPPSTVTTIMKNADKIKHAVQHTPPVNVNIVASPSRQRRPLDKQLAAGSREPPPPGMTLNTVANQRMILTGDRERFKELLRRRLLECGWSDQVRMLCRDVVKENEGSNISIDTLVANVTPRARSLVPDPVKKELLQKIKNHLLSQKDS